MAREEVNATPNDRHDPSLAFTPVLVPTVERWGTPISRKLITMGWAYYKTKELREDYILRGD